MDAIATNLGVFMQMVSRPIWMFRTGIDLFGLLVLVAAIGWTSHLFLKRSMGEQQYDVCTLRIGRSLLFSLAVLTATDIVKTIASGPTFASLGILVGLVLVRKFVNWMLALEIEGLALAEKNGSGPRAEPLAFRIGQSGLSRSNAQPSIALE
jgi:uncharacterized membrane protein